MTIDLFKLLILGVITNWVGLAISLVALLFFFYTKFLSPIRAISYCAFLFCGFAVAHLQVLQVLVGRLRVEPLEQPAQVGMVDQAGVGDVLEGIQGDEIGWQIWATTIAVAISSILGCLASLKFVRHDKLILVIIVMTLLLGFLQFSYMFGGFNYRYLNLYARIYALVCIMSPWFITLHIWRSRKSD